MTENNYKPIGEEAIIAIMKTHPTLTREYIIEKHREIESSISDEEIEEMYNRLENDDEDPDWKWTRKEVRKFLIGMRQAEANLTMDSKFIRNKKTDE